MVCRLPQLRMRMNIASIAGIGIVNRQVCLTTSILLRAAHATTAWHHMDYVAWFAGYISQVIWHTAPWCSHLRSKLQTSHT